MQTHLTTPGEEAPPGHASDEATLRRRNRLPPFDELLIAASLLVLASGKSVALTGIRGISLSPGTALATLAADTTLLGCYALLVLGLLRPAMKAGGRRIIHFITALLLVWSLANAAWLLTTGVQLHVSVLYDLYQSPREFGAIVLDRLLHPQRASMPLLLLGILATGAIVFRLIRPDTRPIRRSRTMSLACVMILTGVALSSLADSSSQTEPLRFSSHGFAFSTIWHDCIGDQRAPNTAKAPSVLKRPAPVPAPPNPERPHIVIIIMESMGWWATTMGGQPADLTPELAELARTGYLFENTRTLITHTTSSQFAVLTGLTPNLSGGYSEAVPADSPFPSLAGILKNSGYRSRFSQMVKATYECNPGLVHNLGFDSFWAREDADNPARHLGYLAGDDFVMLDPAFQWFSQSDQPSLMVFMTSVTHHPYTLPAWFGSTPSDPREAYLAGVRYTDQFVREIRRRLAAVGQLDDTLLCIISDHGEGFGRHGVCQHNENHYEEALRIPWIISWPGRIDEARRFTQNCSSFDVTPTILDLLGYQISPDSFDGRSAIRNGQSQRKLFYSGWYADGWAGWIEGETKLSYCPATGNGYRVNLRRDPAESRAERLSDEESESLRAELEQWRATHAIHYDPRRFYREVLFDRWHTSCLGDIAWCYYVPPKDAAEK